jgi:adenylate kinase family enzyme
MEENKETVVENNEKVILETKITPPEEQNMIKVSINEKQAAENIAKSLFQDFMTLITVVALKAIFSKFPSKLQILNELKELWSKRNSIQLAEETKVFNQSVLDAFSSESTVSEETTAKMNKHIESFNKTRDMAVEIATNAVDQIINSIVEENPPTDTTTDKETV